LKNHACLLGDYCNGAVGLYHIREPVKDLNDMRLAASEERLEPVLPAGMPHVLGDELGPAFWALPKGFELGRHNG
jgi:hypothetical protein